MICSRLVVLGWLVSTSSAFSPSLVAAQSRPLHSTAKKKVSTTTRRHASLLSEYSVLLEEHPIVTASLTAGCLSGLGDVLAQIQERRCVPFRLDLERTQRFILKGLGGGLIWLSWYHFADAAANFLLPPSNNDSTSTTNLVPILERTILSILLDQFLASPIIIAMWEIPVPIILSSEEDNSVIPKQIRSKLGGLLIENAKVWTLANMVIYNLPFEYRVLASSMTDVLWQAILSSHVNVRDSSPKEVGVSTLPLLGGSGARGRNGIGSRCVTSRVAIGCIVPKTELVP